MYKYSHVFYYRHIVVFRINFVLHVFTNMYVHIIKLGWYHLVDINDFTDNFDRCYIFIADFEFP